MRLFELRGLLRGVDDSQNTPQDGMDPAVVDIASRRQARNGELLSRRDCSGIERARTPVIHTAVMCNGVMSGGGVIPADGVATGHGCADGIKIWSSVLNNDLRGR